MSFKVIAERYESGITYLIQDVSTRWHRTFYMIERLVEQYLLLLYFLTKQPIMESGFEVIALKQGNQANNMKNKLQVPSYI